MKISEVNIDALLKKLLDKAAANRLDAGMGGEWGDGGASDLEEQVEIFKCGMAREIPENWIEEAKKSKNEADPEWDEFQRLKGKFEK